MMEAASQKVKSEAAGETSDDEEQFRLYICDDPHSPSPSTLSASRCTPQISNEGFSWSDYLKETGATAAAAECFFQDRDPPVNDFKVNMKIEVPDLRGNGTQCLATIQHVHSVWICVRLDGEDASNDHWMICDDKSISPVGANKSKGNPIQPPYGYKHNISGFHKFIENQLRIRPDGTDPAAPESVFKPISSNYHPQRNKFEVGMKCEAIDYKNFNGRPCPATIVDVNDDYVTINFDGWNDSYNLKMRYDSRYLFPVGWSAKNGLEINPPRKMRGKAKQSGARKETPQKQAAAQKATSRTVVQKPKVQSMLTKKRKSSLSTSSAPPGRKRFIQRGSSSASVHTPTQKPADSRVAIVSPLGENNFTHVKTERDEPSSQSESPSSTDQATRRQPTGRSESALQAQRPVARKTIPNATVSQASQAVRSPLTSQQLQNARPPPIPHTVQPTPAQSVSQSVQPARSPSTTQPAQPVQPLRPASTPQSVHTSAHPLVAPQSVQAAAQQSQPQTSSGPLDASSKRLRLLAPKPKTWIVGKKYGDSVPKNAVASSSSVASDIILTLGDGSNHPESSKMTVYINRYCHCAPSLDSSKVEKLPSQIGPASFHHVFREIVQQIINCAVDSAAVFKEVKPASNHIVNVTAEVTGMTHVRALTMVKSPHEAWERLREFLGKLKVCPYLVKDAPVICPTCKPPENDVSTGDSSDSGRSSHPHTSESGESLSSEDGRLSENALPNWPVERVAREIEGAFDPNVANRFHQNQIDGQALMLLNTDLLMQYLEMPFGPALKMVSYVEMLKKKYRR